MGRLDIAEMTESSETVDDSRSSQRSEFEDIELNEIVDRDGSGGAIPTDNNNLTKVPIFEERSTKEEEQLSDAVDDDALAVPPVPFYRLVKLFFFFFFWFREF